jgi:hypothetical protein
VMEMIRHGLVVGHDGSKPALGRLCLYVFAYLAYAVFLFPYLHSLASGIPFKLIHFSDVQYQLDHWLVGIYSSVLIMELAAFSKTKVQYAALVFANYFMGIGLFLIRTFVESFPRFPKLTYLQTWISSIFDLTLVPFQVLWTLFPVIVGFFVARYMGLTAVSDGSKVRLTWAKVLQISFLFALPFLLCWVAVVLTGVLGGLAAFIPYFFLIPWMFHAKIGALTAFVGIAVLHLGSSREFLKWFTYFAALTPAVVFALSMRDKSQLTSLVSMMIFSGIVFAWRFCVGRVLNREIVSI